MQILQHGGIAGRGTATRFTLKSLSLLSSMSPGNRKTGKRWRWREIVERLERCEMRDER